MLRLIKRLKMSWLSLLAIFALIIPPVMAINRVHSTNTDYNVGDWISYTTTRFVNFVSQGDQYVYFATTGGILRYDFWSNRWEFPWTNSNGLAENYILLVCYDPGTAILWCVTRLSVSYLEPATQYWNNLYFDELGLMSDESVISIGVDSKEIWLYTSRGQLLSSENFGIHFRFRHDVNAKTLDRYDIIWYGAKDKKNRKLPHFFMSDGYLFNSEGYIDDLNLRVWPITSSFTDKWNNAWIGTWGLGAGRGNLATLRMEMVSHGLFDMNVTTIARDRDSFWIGGLSTFENESGITYWDRRAKLVRYFEPKYITGFNSGEINEIAIDGENVWLATNHGLTHYEKRKDRWYTYFEVDHLSSDYIYDVVASEGSIWAATASGISRIEKATVGSDSMKVEWVGWNDLKHSEVYDIHIQDHLVWFAAEWGIYVYNTSQKQGGFVKGPDGAIAGKVTAVSAFGDEVWFGTEKGVEALNVKENSWLPSPARRYQTDQPIRCILTTQDAVWAGTDAGVLKYDRKRAYWRLFTTLDGLIDDDVNAILLDGDYIWFGTAKGLTQFYWNDPNRID